MSKNISLLKLKSVKLFILLSVPFILKKYSKLLFKSKLSLIIFLGILNSKFLYLNIKNDL
ncbi:Uncharacterised protein [Chlamydia trachomatis]|nr:Uncharacterised protein [Chlamydia trachomatis]CRH48064.1 Uncharacterised protein [Chlamydia trachomatis]